MKVQLGSLIKGIILSVFIVLVMSDDRVYAGPRIGSATSYNYTNNLAMDGDYMLVFRTLGAPSNSTEIVIHQISGSTTSLDSGKSSSYCSSQVSSATTSSACSAVSCDYVEYNNLLIEGNYAAFVKNSGTMLGYWYGSSCTPSYPAGTTTVGVYNISSGGTPLFISSSGSNLTMSGNYLSWTTSDRVEICDMSGTCTISTAIE